MADKKKPEKKIAQAKQPEVAKSEKTTALRVEVHFPTITDLKQAIGFDADNNLVMGIQFKVKVDQFETFRLLNLLKQPHGPLYATIGTPQSAMDFKFDKDGCVEIVKAQIAGEKAGKPKELKAADAEPAADKGAAAELEKTGQVKAIHEVTFNHIPEDERPYGVLIEAVNGTGELKSYAGRGLNPTEAVISGVRQCGVVAADVKEPFEVRAALDELDPSPAVSKLIRVLDVGAFDDPKDK